MPLKNFQWRLLSGAVWSPKFGPSFLAVHGFWAKWARYIEEHALSHTCWVASDRTAIHDRLDQIDCESDPKKVELRKWTGEIDLVKMDPRKATQESGHSKVDPSFFWGKKWCRLQIFFKRSSHSTETIKPPSISEAFTDFTPAHIRRSGRDKSFQGFNTSTNFVYGKELLQFGIIRGTNNLGIWWRWKCGCKHGYGCIE